MFCRFCHLELQSVEHRYEHFKRGNLCLLNNNNISKLVHSKCPTSYDNDRNKSKASSKKNCANEEREMQDISQMNSGSFNNEKGWIFLMLAHIRVHLLYFIVQWMSKIQTAEIWTKWDSEFRQFWFQTFRLLKQNTKCLKSELATPTLIQHLNAVVNALQGDGGGSGL